MNLSEVGNVSDTNGTITNLEFNLDSMITNSALFLLAIVPIYIGSFRSITSKKSTDEIEVVSGKDAALFPFLASAALFGIYVVFKFYCVKVHSYSVHQLRYEVIFLFYGCLCNIPVPVVSTYSHWIANNFIAVTVAILAIEFIRLNKFVNGILLLCGLFVYDIFWVFGTGVMMAVAKNLDIPIKGKYFKITLANFQVFHLITFHLIHQMSCKVQ
ncbi:unnamed protein product [Schistosoma margrebowiei]|uniref:Uncharacterized protein n=1 Tax=Schistosoma margrebowiei TaxID=48269 RepID=A0A183LX41_9TREM|nr:unnamed protein product [Schistosoma margrebowiei]